MRLKQLKLAGFKSFANPTTFHFNHTITAIVGPNGCGKSNVIDAIRWVLGESSAKQLRGGAMSDVIFAGTQDKAAKSLASVELVFEHTQVTAAGNTGIHHALNLYHELSVRRQINKEGKSDYFINGTKCRRRDVIDVFLGTGLGARSYAVIEQGMIGRIIDADAKQLREFIEEASGVSRYQQRREETQKQLATAQDNLWRLTDMRAELQTQQQRLEKQASTAQQAQVWQQQIDELAEQLLWDDYVQAWQQAEQLAQTYQQRHTDYEQAKQQLTQLAVQQQALIQAISNKQQQQQAQQQQFQLHWQQQHTAQSELTQQQQQITQQQHQLASITAELERLMQQQAQLLAQQQDAEQAVRQLPDQIAQSTEQVLALKTQQQTLKQQREQVARQLSELNKQKQGYETQLAVTQTNVKHYTQQQAQLEKKQALYQQAAARWQLSHAEFQQTFTDYETTITQFSQQITKISERSRQLENTIIERQADMADQADIVDVLSEQQRQLEHQRNTWQTQHQTLQQVIDQRTHFMQQAERYQSSSTDSNLPHLMSQLTLTELGQRHAKRFDVLASVLDKWAFLNINELTASELEKLSGIPGVVFSKAIDVNDQPCQTRSQAAKPQVTWQPLKDFIVAPQLAISELIWVNTAPVTEQAISQMLAQLAPHEWLWVHDNTGTSILLNHYCSIDLYAMLYRPQVTTSANQSAKNNRAQHKARNTSNEPASPISQRFTQQARMDELEQLIAQQTPKLNAIQAQYQTAFISLQEWQAQDKAARHELNQLKEQHQALEQQQLNLKNNYQRALEKDQQEKAYLVQENQRLADEQETMDTENCYEEQLAVLQKQLAALQPQVQSQIQARQRLEQQLQDHQQKIHQAEHHSQQLQHELAKGQLKIESIHQQLAMLLAEQQRQIQIKSQLAQTITNVGEQLPRLQQNLDTINDQLASSQVSLDQMSADLTALEAQRQPIQQQITCEQANVNELQTLMHQADTQHALAQQNLARIQTQLGEQTINQAADKLIPLSPQARKQQQQQLTRLTNELTALGPVNQAAMAELTEVNERLMPLSAQIDDLTASIDKLKLAIKQTDQQTKQLFMTMLENVNQALNQLFTQVFGGGQAQLVLTDNKASDGTAEEGWQAGLELMAQPKGKKNSRLALLSGGEKTLTALSLIFAIFKQQPAPFCVLDEVDAPLDDANVARFTRLITELAKDLQFIFISHNKLAMQIADELKGVTMPTPGVSKLVSVDMHEVATYLES